MPVGFDKGVTGVCHFVSPCINNTSPKAYDRTDAKRLILIALFHPDFNRRLWNFTKSADTLTGRSRAVTAGGEFHPALRTRQRYTPTQCLPSPIATRFTPIAVLDTIS